MSVNAGPGPQVRTGTGLSVLGKNEKQYRNSTKSIDKNRDKIADNRKNGKEKQRNSKKLTAENFKKAVRYCSEMVEIMIKYLVLSLCCLII